jgi:hypothetical protein
MNKTSQIVARRRESKRPMSSYRVDSTLQTDRCQGRGGRGAALFSFTNIERAHLGC